MEEELKDCPFCGGKADVYGSIDTEWVMCTECYACSDVYDIESGKAIPSWNRRVL